MPVFTSFGGGTESSKLKSGSVRLVVVDADRARTVVVVMAAPRTTVRVAFDVGAGAGGLAAVVVPLHALRVTMPATRTLVARFPTPAS